ncbi:MAG TPA: hypothetical protein DCE56_05365 [Cyanobacteria bacterium UBA8553]|nr:hypothetical protein [Cyanobacteria bacterium UBA8553]HAJ59969.1 hypothetical protein [Cyanobacteria bacterium UBA8543]
MSGFEELLHRIFYPIVKEYHPLADYCGYEECEQGVILYYQGTGEQQHMVMNAEGKIIYDSTLGTTRSVELFAVGTAILGALIYGQQKQ